LNPLRPSKLHDLLSGRRRGAAAGLLRFGLRLTETPYTWAVGCRNWRYDHRPAAVHRVDVPVISVGNLTLGGTGKTPMVEWLAHWFRSRKVRVAIVSRGYGAEAGALSDEARQLQQKLPDVPYLQNPDRVAAARQASAQRQCQLILLDDAFQHRRIGRNLDIVMLDALEPFGFGHVFPRGTLREPISGLRRADVVALSRADMLSPPQREEIRRQVERYAPHCLWVEVAHAARVLTCFTAREEPLSSLLGKPVAAFCGVGNPAGFRHTLAASGFEVVELREFPDHHRYSHRDLASLGDWTDRLEVAAVLCTEKDLVKIEQDDLGGQPLWAVRVGLDFLAGREAFEAKLTSLLPT